MPRGRPAVLTEGLEKSYGKTCALAGLDLAWCVGILLVFVPLSVSLCRRVATR